MSNAPQQELAGLNLPELPISAYDRFDVAFARMIQGDMSGVGRAAFSPESLTPTESKRIYEELGLKSGNKYVDALTKTLTNPLFILGAILAVKFPIGGAQALLAKMETYPGITKMPNRLSRYISSAFLTFRGTKALKGINAVSRAVSGWKDKWSRQLDDVLDAYSKSSGRPLTRTDMYRISAKLDGLDDASGPWLRYHIRTLADQGDDAAKAVMAKLKETGRFQPGNFKLQILDDLRLSPQQNKLVSDIRKLEGRLYKDLKTMTSSMPEEDVLKWFTENGMAVDSLDDLRYFPRAMTRRYIAGGGPKSAMSKLNKILGRTPASPHMSERVNWLLPDMEVLTTELKPWLRPEGLKFMNKTLRDRVAITLRDAHAAMAKRGVVNGQEVWLANKTGPELTTSLGRVFVRAGFDPHIVEKELSILDPLLQSGKVDAALARMQKFVTNGTVPSKVLDKVDDFLAAGQHGEAAGLMSRVLKNSPRAAKPFYDLNLGEAMSSYVHRTSQMWGWGSTNADDLFASGWNQLTGHQKMLLTDRYLPMLKGNHISTIEHAWTEQAYKLAEWLDSPSVKDMMAKVPKGPQFRQWAYNGLTSPTGIGSAHTVGGKMAGWFYLSTIGGNVASSMKNLLQTPMTTLNMVGPNAMFKGWSKAMTGLAKYAKMRLPKSLGGLGLDDAAAMRRAFPEFMKSGVGIDPFSREMMRGQFDAIEQLAVTRPQRAIEMAKRASFSLFQTTERFNRISTYYAGISKGVKDGLDGAKLIGALAKGGEKAARTFAGSELNRYAEYMVELTQFPGSLAGKPYFTLGLPAPARQFMHFPLRYLEFLRHAGWGGTGRAAMTSVGLYNFARAAGIDTEQGLMFGALPLPQMENSPFYPFPFVPPALSVAGHLTKAAMTGDASELQIPLALMTPLGTPIRRAFKAVRRADFKNRRPDGRIPVYDKRGNLISNQTPMQIIGRSIGMYPMNLTDEWALAHYLNKQRDQIRDYRRRYAQALFENDEQAAQGINEEFKRRYPVLKGGIQLKKRDIDAMVRRKERTRIQRIIKGFPKAYQPFFNQVYGMALPGHVEMGPPDAMTPQAHTSSYSPQPPQLSAPVPTQAEAMNRIAQDSWGSQGLSGAWGGPDSASLDGTF